MDKLNQKQRSECMSRVKGKDTGLEKFFRKSVSASKIKGYRLNTNITGRPDLYFPKYRIAVFVDGCFWHGCPRCYIRPETNKNFWADKVKKNMNRDKVVNAILHKDGTKVVRFWGHDVKKNPNQCAVKLKKIIAKYE